MNRRRPPSRWRRGALLLLLPLFAAPTVWAQDVAGQDQAADDQPAPRRKKRKMNPWFEELRKARFAYLPRPPLSPAWDDPEAVRRGSETMERLIEAAGGWEAFQALGAVRYDLLCITRVDTQQKPEPWRVHHYEPRLCHFDVVDGNGYIYSEYARPSLTGPDFVREVLYDDNSWREMRAGFLRTANARRTAWSSVRQEELAALMPFSLELLDASMAFIRTEDLPQGTVDVYAMRIAGDMVVNYYPMMVDEFGMVDEFLVYVLPEEPRVVQLRYAFPDESLKDPPHLRWWNMDFEGTVELGGVKLPEKRFRWLDGWHSIDELWAADFRSETIPPAALRRPWHNNGVYEMPYRCDFWDPPDGVSGLTGHDTGLEHPRPGTYGPDHPKARPTGKFPPRQGEDTGDEDPPPDESPRSP